MEKGKLIVIDGGDGAGKNTQTTCLVQRLAEEGHNVETLDFPQYKENVFGKLLRECLDGKRGDYLEIDPYIMSTLFAADRFETKPKIENWLTEGKVVILDRYVSANMLHQGAKIEDSEELAIFLEWLDSVEHGVFSLPRPDVVVYLDVPAEERIKLLQQAVNDNKNVIDVVESSLVHQKTTEVCAKDIIQKYNNWETIKCVVDNVLRTREDIHNDLYEIVKKYL